jgi:hypothetical protein
MAYEQRDMSGTLWREREKRTEKSPDFTGTILIGRKEWRLAAWIKPGTRGSFLSLKVSEPDPRYARRPQRDADTTQTPLPYTAGSSSKDDDDDIPF